MGTAQSMAGRPDVPEGRPEVPAGIPAVEITELRRSYGPVVAVGGISFTVAEGEIIGVLGPNGAGKTTAAECVTGLRRPDAGQIRVLGKDPQTDGAVQHEVVGVQMQSGVYCCQMLSG